ncbi:exopolyphosphatase PRUNE1 isoform X1 [Leguminivora glycinivorella]|uniref:exopolyphosphatase PRUNE1 isoform X1 n=1 Tax=Leguminivora glycinivorella TaxID=1035111 RepID=UPI00200E17D8|nr:exopolyphosphatase PRUNE1 isoform X1 [Leguminivora glycinivorella]
MEEYLSTTVSNLRSTYYSTLNLTIGNENCSLDSAVSSIVYSKFLHWQLGQLKCGICKKADKIGHKDQIFVPILNLNREDFEIKTEVEYCVNEYGICKEMLVFRNDYNLQELITKTKTNVVLVDHHTLAVKDKFLAPYVTEIIDHRPIDKSEWTYRDDTRSTIEAVGSCCTLVAQRIIDMSAVMAKKTEFFESNTICTQLLHSTIILDTVNFSKEVKKGTLHDLEIVKFLEGILKIENPEAERENKLSHLLEARTNVSRLTAAQLLKKDVKIVKEVYVPSFPILVEEFLSKPGALQAVPEALLSSGCSLALLLGMSLQNGLKRDAAICGSEPDKTAKLAQFLQDWSAPSLQLTPTDLQYPNTYYFNQLYLGASRKQYIPAINAFLQNP